MSAPSKMAMKMFTTALKNHKDEKMRQTAEYISHSYDISDKKYLEPIISYLRGE